MAARTRAPTGAWALSLAFLTNGLMAGTWVSRLPAVNERLAVSDGTFGLILVGSAVGSLVALVLASRACRRIGVRRVFTVSATAWALLYGVAVLCPVAPALFVVLLAIGVMNGVFAVVCNAVGHVLEARSGRPVLPKVHGMFSVGSLAGSIIGARIAGHVGARTHVGVVALVTAAMAFTAARNLPTEGVVRQPLAGDGPAPRRPRSPRATVTALRRPASVALLGVGAIAMCSTLAEGTSNNWAAIFLHHDRGLSEGMAAAGFAVFAGAMATGRLVGNRVARSVRRDHLLRSEGVLLVVGITLLVATHSTFLSFLALASWGLGAAIVFPSAMGAAAAVLEEPTVGISRASLVGFSGFVIGPPLIGGLATVFGLGPALLVVAVVGVALFTLAPFARPRPVPVRAVEQLVGAAA
jgi:MFS family permease